MLKYKEKKLTSHKNIKKAILIDNKSLAQARLTSKLSCVFLQRRVDCFGKGGFQKSNENLVFYPLLQQINFADGVKIICRQNDLNALK